jgi:pSer/pThr/pTyr-binding forkhead associated (FHA) protein
MALTIVVRTGDAASAGDAGSPATRAEPRAEGPGPDPSEARRELELTFDTPRLVIGRGDGCDVRLPDPSVSHRHASIRQRGAEYIVIDEKSTNGTFIGKVALPPHSPRVLRSGELVRVGRVWLEVRIGPAAPAHAPAAAAKELALELVSRGLEAQGEQARPRIEVMAGPDAGKSIELAERGRRYVIGRAKDADLVLTSLEASRRHVDVALKGEHVVTHDLGATEPASLNGVVLAQTDVTWKPGQELTIGEVRLRLTHAAAEALAELERSPDEVIRPGETIPPPASEIEPSADPEPAEAASEDRAAVARREDLARDEQDDLQEKAEEGGWGLTDAAVMLIAASVLALSIVGIVLLLRG